MGNTLQSALLQMIGDSDRPVKNTSLLDFMGDVSGIGTRFIGLITETRPKVRKTGNPHPDVIKLSVAQFECNFDYANKVGNAREKAGLDREYEKGESWFEVVKDGRGRITPMVRHKETGQLYFYVARKPGGKSRYFTPDGQELNYETHVKPFEITSGGSSRQGLPDDKAIHPNTFKVESVKAVKFGGKCLICS